MDKQYLFQVLSLIRRYEGYSLQRIRIEVLASFKSKRKHLDSAAIKEQHYDVYEKKGLRVDDLLEHCVSAGYIKIAGETKHVYLREVGEQLLANLLTNYQSVEYEEYKRAVNEAFHALQIPSIDEWTIMYAYYAGDGVESLLDSYKGAAAHPNEIDYMQHILKNHDINLDQQYAFYFIPHLFISAQDISVQAKSVSLRISGFDAVPELKMEHPYPNRKYVVPASKLKDGQWISGWVPLVAPKNLFPDRFTVELTWLLNDQVYIAHRITFMFERWEYDSFANGLYITEPDMIRACKYAGYKLVSCKDPNIFKRNRCTQVRIQKEDHLAIEEVVTLRPMPIGLLSQSGANQHYGKFYKQKGIQR